MEGQGVSLAQLAEELGISGKTVRRAAQVLGVEGRLERARHGVARCFGPEEAERLRAHLRATGPGTTIEEPGPASAPPAPGQLALPVPPEILDLFADLRDVVARAAAAEGRTAEAVGEVGALREEVRQLREVLTAVVGHLPGPPAPAAKPRLRWRACVEVALLAVVVGLAGVMGTVVWRMAVQAGAVALPTWWPWR